MTYLDLVVRLRVNWDLFLLIKVLYRKGVFSDFQQSRSIRQKKRNENGTLAVPWTVTGSSIWQSSKLEDLRNSMLSLEESVGCILFPEVTRDQLQSESGWAGPSTHGLVFVWEDELIDKSCFSAMGQVSGYVDDTIFTDISQTGAPSNWQIIALAEHCGGVYPQTVHHEVLHALSYPHEHERNKFI